jgi:hypothetical protein
LTSPGTTTRADTVAPAAGTHMVGQRTQGGGSEAQTLLADDATKVRSQSAAAVAAGHSGSRNSRGMWLAAAVVLLIIVGGAAGFFIYRARQSGAAATLPAATPAPSAEPATTTTSAGDVQVEEPQNVNPSADADKRAKQTSTTKPAVKPTPEVADERDMLGRDPNRRPPPEPSPFDLLRNPNDRRPPPEPRVRDFPNGTRVERRADGTTVVTFPDGRTRVFPAGTRPNPRRRPRP